MASIAVTATGTLLKVGDGSGTEVFTTIPEVSKVNIPKVKFDLHDVTSHDSPSGFREYLPGLADGDNVVAEINWVNGNAVHQSLWTDSVAKTKRNFKVVFPAGTSNTCSFSAYITDISINANVGDAIRASITLKVTSVPVWS